MVFWITLILTALGIALIVAVGIIGDKYSYGKENSKIVDFLYHNDDPFVFTGGGITLIGGIVAFIMLIVIITNNCRINARVQKYQETYTALTFKLESGACRDKFGLLSKEIIDEIQNWNEDVVYNQNIQRDFWVGIFYPNVFDEFETIDYERYQSKTK